MGFARKKRPCLARLEVVVLALALVGEKFDSSLANERNRLVGPQVEIPRIQTMWVMPAYAWNF
jgi:hypothetical protein